MKRHRPSIVMHHGSCHCVRHHHAQDILDEHPEELQKDEVVRHETAVHDPTSAYEKPARDNTSPLVIPRKEAVDEPRSPERDLPTEILHMIFFLTVESALGDPDSVLLALSLSHVCRRWRYIAHSLPSLWENITITSVGRKDAGSVRLAATCLAKCRFASLTVVLPRWIPHGCNFLLGALRTSPVQFRRIYLATAFGDLSEFIRALPGHLDYLEELVLHGHRPFLVLDVFRNAPRLQKVTLKFRNENLLQDRKETFELNLPNLRQLHVLHESSLAIDHWRNVLRRNPNLTDASFSLGTWGVISAESIDAHSPSILPRGVPRTQLPHLTRLALHYPADLDFRPWTNDVSFPSIGSLHLHAHYSTNPNLLQFHQLSSLRSLPWWTDRNIFPNLSQDLKKLSLQNIYASSHVWNEIFDKTRSVEELSVALALRDAGASGVVGLGVDAVFDALSRSGGAQERETLGRDYEGQPILLPDLKRLVVYTRDFPLLYPSFQRFLKARAAVSMYSLRDEGVPASSLEVVLGLVDVSGKRARMYQSAFDEVLRGLVAPSSAAGNNKVWFANPMTLNVKIQCLSSSSPMFVQRDDDAFLGGVGSQRWTERSLFWGT